jgi:hypothetical protein
VTLSVGERSETVAVVAEAAEAQVDAVSTQLGELVTGSQMTALSLNGRSYTDLLPIQPGVVPITALLSNSRRRAREPRQRLLSGPSPLRQSEAGLAPSVVQSALKFGAPKMHPASFWTKLFCTTLLI